jgi:hypothetical protein
VTFLRQLALLLPSAFLFGALCFLLTHGRGDPAFGTYPFFEQFAGPGAAKATPEVRFLSQAAVLFVPAYAATLLFVWGVSLAEIGLFGRHGGETSSAYRRSFATVFPVLFLAMTGALLLWTDRALSRRAPGALLAPALTAAVPFVAGALAVLPTALVALPLAFWRKAGEA